MRWATLFVIVLTVVVQASVAPAAGPSPLTLKIEAGDAPPLSIALTGQGVEVVVRGDDESGPVTIVPDAYDQQPMSLTINWTADNSTSLPALLLPAFGGKTLQVYIIRSDFAAAQVDSADDLCFHTRPEDTRSAFRTMFSCQQWVHLLDRAGDRWTKSYLRGLRGWFDGAYYLFTRIHPVRGVGLSPWGLQKDLVDHLRDVTAAIDNKQRTRASFEPFLRVDDIRQALDEYDRWELKLYALVPELVEVKDWDEAEAINQRVKDAYRRLAGAAKSNDAIDGVDLPALEQNAALIQTLQGQSGN